MNRLLWTTTEFHEVSDEKNMNMNKKNRFWQKFHKSFANFKSNYSVLVSMIRNARNQDKMKSKVIIIIEFMWKQNAVTFASLRSHILKIIRKCVLTNRTLMNTLQMLKLVVMYRLRHSDQNIFKKIFSTVADWSRVIDDLFELRTIEANELKILN
jgi:hypothetical protein